MANPEDTQLESSRNPAIARPAMAAVITALVSTVLLVVVVSLDGAFTRGFWQVRWPTWTVACESFISSWAVWIAVVIAGLAALVHDWRMKGASTSAIKSVLVVLLAQAVLIQAMKYGIGRARPCDVGASAWVFVGPNLEYYGFPSGHLAATLAAALAIWRFSRPVGCLLLIWAGLTAWARLHADAHFVGDLIASLLVVVGIERVVAAILAGHAGSGVSRRSCALGAGVVAGVAIVGVGLVILRSAGVLIRPAEQLTTDKQVAIVDGLYVRGLGRVPQNDEKQVYVNRLAGLAESQAGLVKEFGFSTEFFRRVEHSADPAERVRMVYRLVHDREPMAGEVEVEQDTLTGQSRVLREEIRLAVLRLSYAD